MLANNIPPMVWVRGPFAMVSVIGREDLEEIVVAPVEDRVFTDTHTATVALVANRVVRVHLLLGHGEVEEAA